MKVKVSNRVLAKVVDLMLVVAVAAILPYPLGPVLGFVYSLVGDAFCLGPFVGQSIGKKLFKLQVVNVVTKRPASLRESVVRNIPVGIATVFAVIPVVGWFLLALVGVPLMVMEIYLMLTVESGHRLGDVMGDTEVKLAISN